MPIAVLGSPRGKKTAWRATFSNPTLVVSATRIEEVGQLIDTAEQAALAGSYVVLMLSYEAAPAFDSALKTHCLNSIPLAWAAVFDVQSEFPLSVSRNYIASPFESRITRDQYNEAVHQIHELIRAGATYQVNYSIPLVSKFSGDVYELYLDLCAAQDANFCAFLDLGRYQIVSLSPELFFTRQGNRVTTKPMKGTASRGRWPQEDQAYAQALANSAKDQAENVMIVDLLRNDLGKVSVPGSVHVPRLFELERFETLWQMTSTVESTLKDGTSLRELIAAVFPCGSITGAPKIRTMEIIRDLEPHPRGIYTGTIGLIRPGGDCTFNVAIRTIVLDSKSRTATFGVGGGITIDSTAEREYDECVVKSTFLRTRPVEFNLFESLLLEEGEYFLLERHLERLSRSADYFSFEITESDVRQSLAELATSHSENQLKVKIEFDKSGKFRISSEKISADNEVRRVALASKPVDSSNRFLFHKTTHRDFYMSELNQRHDCDDIIFWNERGEITESSIANIVVRIGDKLYTPPIESGLLAGTYRAQLIVEGSIRERVISIDDLRCASELFLINSVRKWMPAKLATSNE
jgi:para-aminobenzoate synthetase/4-amino-4-deoxychorismate lyase